MTRRVAIYGGSFSPPGNHHVRVAEALTSHFDEVIVVPCGPRPDKMAEDDTEPVFRAALADIAFSHIPKVTVELFDLEQATFTRTHALEDRYADRGEIWHVVGTDLVAGGASRASPIHTSWERADELWNNGRFVVVTRPGHPLSENDLPPTHQLIELDARGSSSEIRELRYHGEPVDHLVSKQVAEYISRHRLYRGRIAARVTRLRLEEARALIVCDERNPKARAWRAEFEPYSDSVNPNCILVLGGDGSMLRAIQEHWRRRLPFLGVNAGNMGFLLNDHEQLNAQHFPPEELILRQMPLIYAEFTRADGRVEKELSFNDVWVERATGQTAWVKVKVDDHMRLSKVVCDGILLSTAAGSTAYARAMGATPLLADTPAWLVVGSNVMDPVNWTSALLSPDATVEIESLDPYKRPLNGFAYGVPMGEVTRMTARISRIAAAELAFVVDHDMSEKIARIQFPDRAGS